MDFVNPDEKKAEKILSMVQILLDECQMDNYASYSYVCHKIADMVDQQMRRLNERHKYIDSHEFKHWMKRVML